ncbi:FUN34 transmembrane protein [Vararia minispora EC-137]|uniref:FUN34 transmembrane protein n=1 Tax=Vararia minispora EC-137 TaxID=1314806 RepID=A0ACB8QKQ8_9AGAM|nr:FUN34 transmembrane protein [Vararia minispora EC-137]
MSDVEKGAVQANPMPRSTLPPRRLGNPAPLGLFAFATTTLILSLYNVNARGISVPNVVVGMALFYGGLAQFLAGMWEFACGNTFGATAFSSYGGFWLSYATIFIPSSGIVDAFNTHPPAMFASAVGIYLMAWMTVTFLFLIASLRRSIAFIALFGFLTITFMLLGAGFFTANDHITIGGGAFGIVTALVAYYIGTADLLENDGIVVLPLGAFKARTA